MKERRKWPHWYMHCLLVIAIIFAVASSSFAGDKYVNKSCSSGCDGTTWAKGWSELNQVTGLAAGDTLWISGGSSGQTYTTTLTLDGNNATSGNRIYIRPGAAHPTSSSGHEGLVTVTVSGPGFLMYRNYYTLDGSANQTDGGTKKIGFSQCLGNAVTATGKGVIVKNCHFYQNSVSDTGNSATNNSIRGDWSGTGSTESFLGEISYNYIDDPFYMGIWVSGPSDRNVYGLILVHHNEMVNFGGEDGYRVDGGTDCYNNLLHGRVARHSAGYHPDGIVTMASYTRIYNNIVYDFYMPGSPTDATNSYYYVNPFTITAGSTSCCIRVYNNLAYQTSVGQSDDYVRGLEMSWQTSGGSWSSISDIVVANNTIVGMPIYGFSFYPSTVGSSGMSNIYIVNNIFHNNGILSNQTQISLAGVTVGNWTVGSWGSGANVIWDYNINSKGNGRDLYGFKGSSYTYASWKTAISGNANVSNETNDPNLTSSYRLPSGSSNARNTGRTLSSYFTTDLEGISRPQGSAWDIGAYEFDESLYPKPPSSLRILN